MHTHIFLFAVQEIKIVAEPEDVTIVFSDAAFFKCSYTGTTVAPFWIIDEEVFTIDRLPGRHFYSNHVLTVKNNWPSHSGKTYRCSFGGQESRTAELTVLNHQQCKHTFC